MSTSAYDLARDIAKVIEDHVEDVVEVDWEGDVHVVIEQICIERIETLIRSAIREGLTS